MSRAKDPGDVAVAVLPVFSKPKLVRGTKPVPSPVVEAPETTLPAEESVA